MMVWLAELIGLKGMVLSLVKWALRLCLVVGLVALGIEVYNNAALQVIAVRIVLLWLLWLGLRWSYRLRPVFRWSLRLLLLAVAAAVCGLAETKITIALALLGLAGVFYEWRRSRQGEAAGERTIDGKVVPDKLAVAALDIPLHSPDGDYVLRGLPDFGKALLKLNHGDFQYVPEIGEPEPEPVAESPLNEPAAERPWLSVLPWLPMPEDAGWLLLAVAGGGLLIVSPHIASAVAATLWLAWWAATALYLRKWRRYRKEEVEIPLPEKPDVEQSWLAIALSVPPSFADGILSITTGTAFLAGNIGASFAIVVLLWVIVNTAVWLIWIAFKGRRGRKGEAGGKKLADAVTPDLIQPRG